MNDWRLTARARARTWLEFAADQYPDRTIPPELGGAWLTEISIKTGCDQPTVERLAREMRVWSANPVQVHAAHHAGAAGGAPVPLIESVDEPGVSDED